MPLLDESRKMLTDLLAAVDTVYNTQFVNFSTHRVMVQGTGSIEPIGTPLVWNATDEMFEVYVDQPLVSDPDATPAVDVGSSSLPGGYVACISVGRREGVGLNKADIELNTDDGAEVSVLFRGPSQIKNDGIEWGTADPTAQAAFIKALELQNISVVDAATEVDPVLFTPAE